MSNDLLKQIDDLVATKTFSLDALDGIKGLKDSLAKTLNELETNKRALLQQQNANLDLTKQLEVMTGKMEFLNGLVKANEETGKKGQAAIYEAEKYKAVADTWQSAMAMVFKPNAVRESIQRNHTVMVPTTGGGGYPQSVQNQDHIVREDA